MFNKLPQLIQKCELLAKQSNQLNQKTSTLHTSKNQVLFDMNYTAHLGINFFPLKNFMAFSMSLLPLALFATANAAVPPPPPSKVCLETTQSMECAASQAPSGNYPSTVNPANFHPGYYMLVGPNDSTWAFDTIKDQPAFIGVNKIYNWRAIEPSEGVYDFSEMEADLAYLESIGKRLWVSIRFVQNQSKHSPLTPTYMWNDPKYGCDPRFYGNYQRSVNQGGWLPCIWNENVQARFAILYTALGKRFNHEPFFEGTNIDETSTGKTEWGYSPEKEEEGFKARVLALKQAFPDKSVIQMINYAAFDLVEFSAWLAENEIGIGGPDVHFPGPYRKALHSIAYPQYLKYHDVVPTAPNVQWANYETKNPDTGVYYTAEEILKGAIEFTNPWYLFWDKRQPYFNNDVVPAVRRFGPLPAVKEFYNSQK